MAVAAIAFVLAGTAKGALGIGLPPIAIGIMTLALPVSDALALLLLPTLLTNMAQAFWGRRFFPVLRRFAGMGAASVVGVLGAGMLLGKLGSPTMIGWMGVLLVLYAALALFAWRPVMPVDAELWAGPVIGFLSGVVTGITGMAAVPFLPYMQSLQISRDDLVQALGIMFTLLMAALAVALVQQNIFTAANGLGSAVALAPTFAGVWLGQRLRRAASPELFRKIFLYGLLALGLNMMLSLR